MQSCDLVLGYGLSEFILPHVALFHFQGNIELPQNSKYMNSCGIPTFFSSGLAAQREIM
jgi:hypothetical protein